ncbi:MAG: protein kinase [Acidobacteriota bacterium]
MYRVRHRQLGEECLIKVRPHGLDDDPVVRERFHSRLGWFTRRVHGHLAQVFDVLQVPPSLAVLEVEAVEGPSLGEVIEDGGRRRGGALPLGLALRLADQCLAPVAHLHADGWVHGGLSPSKWVLRGRSPQGPPRLLLVDPGFARLVGAPDHTTAGGALLRKLRYQPPESFPGDAGPPTPAADVYALGLVLFELLTGRFPISGDNPSSLAAGHMLRPHLGFDAADPEHRLGPELRRTVSRCLAKQPEERYPTAAELRRALDLARSPALSTREAPGAGEAPGDGSKDPLTEDDVIALWLSADGSRAQTAVGFATRTLPAAERRAAARGLLERAREAVAAAEFTVARSLLKEGLKQAPEDPKLAAVLRQVERAAHTGQIEARRRRDLDAEVGKIEGAIRRGDAEAARGRLGEAGARFGGDPRLRDLGQRIDELDRRAAEASRERIERRAQAEALVERARRLSQTEDFEEALATLRQVRALVPDLEEARALSDSVKALIALRREEESKRHSRQRTCEEIRRLLEKGDPGAAMAALQKAVGRYGDREDLQELRYDIAQAFLAEDVDDPPPHAVAPPPPPPASSAPPPREAPAADPGPGKDRGPGKGVQDVSLRGLGGGTLPPPPTTVGGAERPGDAGPRTDGDGRGNVGGPSWLDWRTPRFWVLIVVLALLFAALGHQIATSHRDRPAPRLEVPEAQDVESPWRDDGRPAEPSNQ